VRWESRWLALRLRARRAAGLAELVEQVAARPEAEVVMVPAEVLMGLEAEAGWPEVGAWLAHQGVRLVAVGVRRDTECGP
jgi:hypothetical protein